MISEIDELSHVMTGEETIQNNFGNIEKKANKGFLKQ